MTFLQFYWPLSSASEVPFRPISANSADEIPVGLEERRRVLAEREAFLLQAGLQERVVQKGCSKIYKKGKVTNAIFYTWHTILQEPDEESQHEIWKSSSLHLPP